MTETGVQLGFAWAGAAGSELRFCAHCGEPFRPADPATGRRVAFCGEVCREAHRAAQRRAWYRDNPAAADRRSEVACIVCGRTFVAPAAHAGRLPRLCSDECRKARKAMHNRRWKRQYERARRKPK